MARFQNTTGPLVTVLMSTYNRPAYLDIALKSILNQTYDNLQVIVVRDGGEPVREIVSRYKDSRVVFIDRDENRGLPCSFNEALSRARGKYVCYLGDDDLFYPNHVDVLVNALEGQNEFGAAYTDLYKVHCRIDPTGRRHVLAKNVEISRDFDRMAILQFNHILHVSLMHRRDLLEKIGPCNEKLNVLIDWDLTRRLSFFTDFKHVNVVTGEFYASVSKDADRISVRKRKDVNSYILNLMTIRSTRPAKPWPKMEDMSLILLADRLDSQVEQSLRQIWSHTFFPYSIYLPLEMDDLQRLQGRTIVPNIMGIAVPSGSSDEARIDAALELCDGEYVAIVPSSWRIRYDDVAWIEKSLNALMNSHDPTVAYELIGCGAMGWGAVFRREQLTRARRLCGHLPFAESLQASGISVRQPEMREWPFQFENLVTNVQLFEKQGNWLDAARILEKIPELYGNDMWMKARRSNALFHAGLYEQSAELAGELNAVRPTVATLLLESRGRQKLKDFRKSISLLTKAENILEGRELAYAG